MVQVPSLTELERLWPVSQRCRWQCKAILSFIEKYSELRIAIMHVMDLDFEELMNRLQGESPLPVEPRPLPNSREFWRI